jgi:hypothetical protein
LDSGLATVAAVVFVLVLFEDDSYEVV